MVAIAEETIWSCVRDYWRLEIVRAPMQTDRLLVRVRGRRRTTEAFAGPLVMDLPAVWLLSWSFQSALAVATGFQAAGIQDHRLRFPTRELLARCCGAFYQLDIHGTVVAGDVESVELLLIVPSAGAQPVLHLIDADMEVFAADMAEALGVMRDHCTHVDRATRRSQ